MKNSKAILLLLMSFILLLGCNGDDSIVNTQLYRVEDILKDNLYAEPLDVIDGEMYYTYVGVPGKDIKKYGKHNVYKVDMKNNVEQVITGDDGRNITSFTIVGDYMYYVSADEVKPGEKFSEYYIVKRGPQGFDELVYNGQSRQSETAPKLHIFNNEIYAVIEDLNDNLSYTNTFLFNVSKEEVVFEVGAEDNETYDDYLYFPWQINPYLNSGFNIITTDDNMLIFTVSRFRQDGNQESRLYLYDGNNVIFEDYEGIWFKDFVLMDDNIIATFDELDEGRQEVGIININDLSSIHKNLNSFRTISKVSDVTIDGQTSALVRVLSQSDQRSLLSIHITEGNLISETVILDELESVNLNALPHGVIGTVPNTSAKYMRFVHYTVKED